MTGEGAAAFTRGPQSELFLLCTTSFAGEDTFYENDKARLARFQTLTRGVAVSDQRWLFGFLYWLRTKAYIRHWAVWGAVEACYAIKGPAGGGTHIAGQGRDFLGAVLKRQDEPGEAIGYAHTHFGRKLPTRFKKGVADAVRFMADEYGFLKYDSDGAAIRYGDVVALTHPKPMVDVHVEVVDGVETFVSRHVQAALFKHAMDVRHGRDAAVPAELPMIAARQKLMAELRENRAAVLALPVPVRRQRFWEAGLTWEAFSSFGPMTAQVWEAILPQMPHMAVLRNLRNFEKAGLVHFTPAALLAVQKKISDPAEVAKGMQLPFRYLSAHLNTTSMAWGDALEKALTLSLTNIPAGLDGTLILVDTSASMDAAVTPAKAEQRHRVKAGKAPSQAVRPNRMDVGALFGLALAAKNPAADLYGFANGDTPFLFRMPAGGSVLRAMSQFRAMNGQDGHGTEIAKAMRKTFDPSRHKRVVIFTDEQTAGDHYSRVRHGDVNTAVPADVPVYSFNLGGYEATPWAPETLRFHLGGLTDATFSWMVNVEAGVAGRWPWEQV